MQIGTSAPLVPLIVVPCLNEARHIGPLLGKLFEARERLGGLLVVVDGGSRDGTERIAARAAEHRERVHVLNNPARIQSAGINLAVERFGAAATHLIRIDAHCAYPDDYCDLLLDEARRTGAAAVVVSMAAHGQGLLQRVIAAAQNAPVGNGGSKHRNASDGEYVEHGHHALVSLAAFRAVGGYDPSFAHNEDAEFDYRLAKAGFRIWLTGRTRVTYFPRHDMRGLAGQYFNHGAGRARNLLKHRTMPKARQAKVIAILPLVALSGLAGVSPVFLVPAALWLGYCVTMAAALAIRSREFVLLLAAPMAMVMHLSWSAGFWKTMLLRPPARRAVPA